MSDQKYLIALALIKLSHQRAMPLGGKSLNNLFNSNKELGEIAKPLIIELMLRVFQRSESDPLQRAAKEMSLVLIQISFETMQQEIPKIKGEWMSSGDDQKFFSCLKHISDNVWSVNFTREDGIIYKSIDT